MPNQNILSKRKCSHASLSSCPGLIFPKLFTSRCMECIQWFPRSCIQHFANRCQSVIQRREYSCPQIFPPNQCSVLRINRIQVSIYILGKNQSFRSSYTATYRTTNWISPTNGSTLSIYTHNGCFSRHIIIHRGHENTFLINQRSRHIYGSTYIFNPCQPQTLLLFYRFSI